MMKALELQKHVGKDGIVTLELPAYLSDIDVVITVKPAKKKSKWPPNYFKETYGALKDEPIDREPQGDYEEREEIL